MSQQSGTLKIVFTDAYFMRMALQEAERAYEAGEVPVGAVVVSQNRVIARAHNQVEKLQDATAHAEMLALTAAFNTLGTKYLPACTLYVTLEPCLMCSSALYWAKLARLVFGASDPNRGYRKLGNNSLHPRTEVCTNVLADESQKILQDFFLYLRHLVY
ncbi:MAG: nucleoside deaminase [Bacteroidota bacterium]